MGKAFPLLTYGLWGASALTLLSWAPSADGRVTLVSLTGESGDAIAAWALNGQRAAAAKGDYSLTVVGADPSLIAEAVRRGAVPIAANAEDCAPAERS